VSCLSGSQNNLKDRGQDTKGVWGRGFPTLAG
jgi:hypothetical protein